MKKYEYRCNRCMIIEDRLLHGGVEPLCSVACSKCGGLAIRLPVSGSIECVFFRYRENEDRLHLLSSRSRTSTVRIKGLHLAVQPFLFDSIHKGQILFFFR
jgi:hypothetical protein